MKLIATFINLGVTRFLILGFIFLGFSHSVCADMKTALFHKMQIQKAQLRLQHQALKNNTLPNSLLKESTLTVLEQRFALNEISRTNTGVFKQNIDHFSKPGADVFSKRFNQRYWVDATFVDSAHKESAPVIYVICGEAPCDGPTGMAAIDRLAQKKGAYRVALEHRYYGESLPFNDLSTPHLKYLSTPQAIEDLATFQIYAMNVLGLKGKWLSVGGSYAGSLSAYYREKHPELVSGALSSSGPVLAKANFFEYDRHVAREAGANCLAKIKEVVSEVERRMDKSPADLAEVKKLFLASEVRDPRDFLYVLADMASIAIQYGKRDQFCNALENTNQIDDSLRAYADVGNQMLSWFGIDAVKDSFQGAESINPRDYTAFGARSWFYQSCMEYGYYQVANPNPLESARSTRITESYHNEVCNRLFGIKVPVDTKTMNQAFYQPLLDSKTSQILFTNGTSDPWSNLSILEGSTESKKNPLLSFLSLQGFSHCSDLGGKIITQAYDKTNELFELWLK